MDETPPSYKNKVLRFFSNHPLLGLLGALGSVASLVALPYTIFTPKRALTFAINSPRTPIVQLARTSNISVSYNGTVVNKDVTAAQIAIWNAGREPIRGEDILTPIVLRTADNAPILELSAGTNEVTKFDVDPTKMFQGQLRIGWRILEHNDGAVIQIIYVGKPDLPIVLDGAIIGQRHALQLSDRSKRLTRYEEMGNLFASVCGVGIGLVVVKRFDTRSWKSAAVAMIIICLLGFSIPSLTHLLATRMIGSNPFGF